MRVTTLGDLLLDVIVTTAEPLVTGDDRPATTLVGAGGQAANVAAWVAALGGSARFVGKRGDDAAGELVGAELRAYGVDVVGPVEGGTGVVVSIAAAGERTMASDRGSAPELTVGELHADWFDCELRALLNSSVAFCSLSQSTTTASKCSAINFLTAAKGSVQEHTSKSNSLRTCFTVRAVFSSGQKRSAW